MKSKLHAPVTSILRQPHYFYGREDEVQGYTQFTPEVFEQEGFNHEQEHQKWEERTGRQLSYHNNAKDKEKYKIPPITHSVYLTSDQNPNPMKELYIDNYGKTSERLSAEDSNFVHYLWVNFDPKDPKYKDVIPEEIRAIPNLKIRNIRKFEDHPLYQNTADFLENGRSASKFVEASDLVRVMAMEAKGGVYHDLDWKLYDAKEMIRYMKNFDFIGGREGEEWTSSIGNAMFAAKAEHPVTKKLSQLIDRNLNEKDPDLLPDYIKYPQREFDRIISSSGPIAITMAYNLAGNKDKNRDLICPSKILYNADYARSHQIGNHHNPEELKHSWNYMPIKTIGGDQFSGNWGHTYLDKIRYNSDIMNPLIRAIKDNNMVGFEHILFDIDKEKSANQRILGDTLKYALKINNQEMIGVLLPKITVESVLGNVLSKAIEKDNIKVVEVVVSQMWAIKKFWAIGKLAGDVYIAIDKENSKLVEALLTKDIYEDVLWLALYDAIKKDNIKAIDGLASKITSQSKLEKALSWAVEKDNQKVIDELLPKVTDQDVLEKVIYKAIEKDNIEVINELLPKLGREHLLGKALSWAIEKDNQKIIDKLLPTITNQGVLEKVMSKAVEKDNIKIINELFPKVTDQYSLGVVLSKAIEKGNQEVVEVLAKVTNQDVLSWALQEAVDRGNQKAVEVLVPKIENSDKTYSMLERAKQIPNNEAVVNILYNHISLWNKAQEFGSGINKFLKKNDPLKLLGGAEAANVRDTSHIMEARGADSMQLDKSLPGGNRGGKQGANIHSSSISMSAEQLNQNLYMGFSVLAITMKAFGQDTEWLKPVIGGGTTELQKAVDPKTFLLYEDPKYDYSSKLNAPTKKISPIQQAITDRITQAVESEKTKEFSKDQWQEFINNDMKLIALMIASKEERKIAKKLARPLTHKNSKINHALTSQKKNGLSV